MNKELLVLLVFLIAGIIIGLLFDFFRILRKSFKTPDGITYIQDILFWVLSGFIVIFVLCNWAAGEIRLYMILTIITGTFIYFITLSKYFIRFNVKMISAIKHFILFIFKPFKFIFFKISNLLKGKKCKF